MFTEFVLYTRNTQLALNTVVFGFEWSRKTSGLMSGELTLCVSKFVRSPQRSIAGCGWIGTIEGTEMKRILRLQLSRAEWSRLIEDEEKVKVKRERE